MKPNVPYITDWFGFIMEKNLVIVRDALYFRNRNSVLAAKLTIDFFNAAQKLHCLDSF